MFELWDPADYIATYFTVVDQNGTMVHEITELCHQIRLLRGDDVYVNAGKGFIVTGESGKVVTYEININQ